ncbi:hypothetical protein M432DRAFT_600377 [Thermoascus aurantiacus ATCC 26904]
MIINKGGREGGREGRRMRIRFFFLPFSPQFIFFSFWSSYGALVGVWDLICASFFSAFLDWNIYHCCLSCMPEPLIFIICLV